MEAVSQEVYAQIKAQVLEEWAEERKREAKRREEARIAERIATDNVFSSTRKKYYLPLAKKCEALRRTGHHIDCVQMIDKWLKEAENMALQALGEWDKASVYKNGKVDEANKIMSEVLETIIQD